MRKNKQKIFSKKHKIKNIEKPPRKLKIPKTRKTHLHGPTRYERVCSVGVRQDLPKLLHWVAIRRFPPYSYISKFMLKK